MAMVNGGRFREISARPWKGREDGEEEGEEEGEEAEEKLSTR
jgi:hypothetical protein